MVRKDNGNDPQYEYINKVGNYIFKPNLKYAQLFSNNLALVSTDKINFEYINSKGIIVYKLKNN
ncbi:hypothetical protein [Clostridium tyrobutyricum]|uniref:hypothetical protein n=1 Tax=Clostridium tyrobutyricum TaxID=1519 RepID=UPI00164EAA6C